MIVVMIMDGGGGDDDGKGLSYESDPVFPC